MDGGYGHNYNNDGYPMQHSPENPPQGYPPASGAYPMQKYPTTPETYPPRDPPQGYPPASGAYPMQKYPTTPETYPPPPMAYPPQGYPPVGYSTLAEPYTQSYALDYGAYPTQGQGYGHPHEELPPATCRPAGYPQPPSADQQTQQGRKHRFRKTLLGGAAVAVAAYGIHRHHRKQQGHSQQADEGLNFSGEEYI